MVNDDKPFLHITDQGVFVCGTPWMGKHNLGNNMFVGATSSRPFFDEISFQPNQDIAKQKEKAKTLLSCKR